MGGSSVRLLPNYKLKERTMAGEIKNIKFQKSADGILTLTIDLNKNFGPSSSGKNLIVASSGGFNSTIVEGITFNITATKKIG